MAVGYVFITETEPVISLDAPDGWLWFKLVGETIEIYSRSNSDWNHEGTISLSNHTHTTLGAMSFTGDVHFGEKIYAGEGDANRGKNQVVTIPGVCTMTFKKGLLTDYEIIVPP